MAKVPPAPWPAPPDPKEPRYFTIRRYWGLASRHAIASTRRQNGDHPVTLVLAVALAIGGLVVGTALDPGSFTTAARSLAVAALVWVLAVIVWYFFNLAAAPHRMWREAGMMLAHLHVVAAKNQVVQIG